MMASNLRKGVCMLVVVFVAGPAIAGDVDLDTDLWVHWTFDEGSGQITYDQSPGDTRDAILGQNSNAGDDDPTWVASGQLGHSLDFDGTDDYLSVGGMVAIGTFDAIYCVLFRIKEEDSGRYQWLISNNDDFTSPYFRLGLSDSQIRVYTEANVDAEREDFVYCAESYDDNKWHHVIVSRSGSVGDLYVDGAYKATFDTVGESIGDEPAWFIGQSGAIHEYFNGYMDEVRVYRGRAIISQDEVDALYAASIPEPGTLAVLAVGGLCVLLRRRRTA